MLNKIIWKAITNKKKLWKAVDLTTVWNSKHLLKTQDETEIGKPYDSVHHVV